MKKGGMNLPRRKYTWWCINNNCRRPSLYKCPRSWWSNAFAVQPQQRTTKKPKTTEKKNKKTDENTALHVYRGNYRKAFYWIKGLQLGPSFHFCRNSLMNFKPNARSCPICYACVPAELRSHSDFSYCWVNRRLSSDKRVSQMGQLEEPLSSQKELQRQRGDRHREHVCLSRSNRSLEGGMNVRAKGKLLEKRQH